MEREIKTFIVFCKSYLNTKIDYEDLKSTLKDKLVFRDDNFNTFKMAVKDNKIRFSVITNKADIINGIVESESKVAPYIEGVADRKLVTTTIKYYNSTTNKDYDKTEGQFICDYEEISYLNINKQKVNISTSYDYCFMEEYYLDDNGIAKVKINDDRLISFISDNAIYHVEKDEDSISILFKDDMYKGTITYADNICQIRAIDNNDNVLNKNIKCKDLDQFKIVLALLNINIDNIITNIKEYIGESKYSNVTTIALNDEDKNVLKLII